MKGKLVRIKMESIKLRFFIYLIGPEITRKNIDKSNW